MLKKGTLWPALVRATEQALRIGALFSIPTEYEFVEDSGVRFFVRILTSLARKDEERERREREAGRGQKVNPFLPYDRDLFVADVSESHVALLNKFNVVEHHLLIVTREFEDQETLLTLKDFEALWVCLEEFDSLGFYNAGEAAGASQSHKHLQAVPLPLAPAGPGIPVQPLLAAEPGRGIGTLPGFPFLHAFVRLDNERMRSPQDAAGQTFALYGEMLRNVCLKAPADDRTERRSAPYCFLVTREWMLLIPRTREFFQGISINSLGFAGALLVRDEDQMNVLKRYGPMTALKNVAFPAAE